MLVGTHIETALFFALCIFACSAAQVPKFRRVVLDDNFAGGYQVVVEDIDGDGKPDVLALGEGRGGQIAWYKNPSWRRYPVSVDATKDNVDFAVHDIDGDGEFEIAVASDFRLQRSTSGGTISWLKRRKNLDDPWAVHRIDAEPTTHRLRWADVDGDGKKELICVPILGRGARAPQYDQAPAPLLLYRIPQRDPLAPWPKEIIDETLHVTHGIAVYDFDGDGRDELLTASFEGVYLFDLEGKGKDARWRKTRLCAGNQQRKEARGSSEVCVGKLRGGRRFIAT
ncbi:VCBS repeat-containing protein, partial [bacterium]|nr:VCBS repeat-containing protein [bacterium]